MTFLPYLVVVWLFLIGLYGIVTSRNTIHLVSCLFVSQSSTYVLLLSIGYKTGGTAQIFSNIPQTAPAVDPVVQALVLTDIVVGATVSALILVFAVQVHKRMHSTDPGRIRTLKG